MKIIARYIEGMEVTGFVVKDIGESGEETKLIRYSDAVIMTRRGKIENAEAIMDDDIGEYKIFVKDEVEAVVSDRKEKFRPAGRIVDKVTHRCLAYSLIEPDGGNQRVTAAKMWDMASRGMIDGVKGVIFNGKRTLLSDEKGTLEKL